MEFVGQLKALMMKTGLYFKRLHFMTHYVISRTFEQTTKGLYVTLHNRLFRGGQYR
jgi:hypothetical protein